MLMTEHHFSKRKSEKAVNAVFDCMARALRLGEIVELPIGWIHTARPPAKRKKQKLQKFRNIQINRKSQTKEIFSKIVTYPDKIIRFRANPRLIEKGPFPPPPPLRPEMINKGEELEQLLAGLGFPDVTGWT
jgi:nucleoid DNA-binding protein